MSSKTDKRTRNENRLTLKKKFKNIVRFIFRPVSNVIDHVQTFYYDQSIFKKTLISVVKLKHIIIPALLIVILSCGTYFWFHTDNTASMIMSLNYEESAKGLNPNSTRFNIYEVKSKDVIEKMLDYFGISEKSVDIEEIANSITITPCNLKEFDVENYYITTSYTVTLTKPSSIKGVTANDMLIYLNKAYKDKFYNNYTENLSILSFDIEQFDESEYMTIADLLSLKAQQQSKYLNMRKKQSKTFADEDTGETFVSLSEKINNFCNYDIPRYRSFVLETGISHNKVHYVRTLDYKNSMNEIDYKKNIASFDVRYDGISLYDESMISIVMIPTIDYENNSYYMSKTKTGMDKMAKQADDFLESAQTIAKSIEESNAVIKKINAGANKPTDIDKANRMIVEMQNKLASLSKEIEHVDKEYIAYKTNDYITMKFDDISLGERLQVETLAVITIVICAAVFFLLWLKLKRMNRGDKR